MDVHEVKGRLSRQVAERAAREHRSKRSGAPSKRYAAWPIRTQSDDTVAVELLLAGGPFVTARDDRRLETATSQDLAQQLELLTLARKRRPKALDDHRHADAAIAQRPRRIGLLG